MSFFTQNYCTFLIGYPPQNWLPMLPTALIISMVLLVVGCGNCSSVTVNMVVLATIVVLVAVVSICSVA
jgi:hypothetical protein